MRLATLRDGTRDGRLVVVRRDRAVYAEAAAIAPHLQSALDQWDAVAPRLAALAAQLEAGHVAGTPVAPNRFHAPLPRAYEWLDGSAFLNHVELVRKSRGAPLPETLTTDPLVYQGGSGVFLGPTDDIPWRDPAWGLDFEAEVAVILGDTPMGTTAHQAASLVRLVTIVNDVSLRGLVPAELAKGFGFVTAKPATAFAPCAVTPDELGPAWSEGRVHLPLVTTYNGKRFGDPNAGPEMHFSFYDLMAHITKSRALTAGTIIGSGTVSNRDRARGSSCLVEARMIEQLELGAPKTPFMQVGDTVQIEMRDAAGHNLFGSIAQRVVAWSA